MERTLLQNMPDFQIYLNAGDLMKKLGKQATDKAIGQGLSASLLHLESAVKHNMTSFTRTGRLRSSITTRIKGKTGTIGTNVNYGPYVEYGTRPHLILPRYKKILAWPIAGQSRAGLGRGPQGTLKGKGQFAYARVVHHPGFKGHHYMRRALDDNRKIISSLFQRFLADALGK